MSAQSFDDLIRHSGHEVEVAEYFDHSKQTVNVAIECVECYEVLLDFDKEDNE